MVSMKSEEYRWVGSTAAYAGAEAKQDGGKLLRTLGLKDKRGYTQERDRRVNWLLIHRLVVTRIFTDDTYILRE